MTHLRNQAFDIRRLLSDIYIAYVNFGMIFVFGP